MSRVFCRVWAPILTTNPKLCISLQPVGTKEEVKFCHKEFTSPCVRNRWEQIVAEHSDKPLSDTSHTLLPDNYKQLNTQLQLHPFFGFSQEIKGHF